MKPNYKVDNNNKTRQAQQLQLQHQQTQTQPQPPMTPDKLATSDFAHQAGDQVTPAIDNNNLVPISNGLNFTLSEDKRKEIVHNDVQRILENDLSCAICHDVYINPLILNCSHSFCKFCACRWLSKKTVCPECRMTVSFQAENLALKNVINTMVQKSSPQFQEKRTNSVKTRLKDEEEQTKKEGLPRILRKDNNNHVSRPQGARSRWQGRSTLLYLPNLFQAIDSATSPRDGEALSNSSDSSGSTFPRANFDLSIGIQDEDDVMEDSDDDFYAIERESDQIEEDDFDGYEGEHDTTFELETEDESDSSQSENDEEEDMDDESFADLDVIGDSDSESVRHSVRLVEDSDDTEIEGNDDNEDDDEDDDDDDGNADDTVATDNNGDDDDEPEDEDDEDYYYYDSDEDLTSDAQSLTSVDSSSSSSIMSSSDSEVNDSSDEIEAN